MISALMERAKSARSANSIVVQFGHHQLEIWVISVLYKILNRIREFRKFYVKTRKSLHAFLKLGTLINFVLEMTNSRIPY